MKLFSTLFLALLISYNVQAQFYNKKISGEGKVTTSERSVGSFDEIGVAGSFDVTLTDGNVGEITIQAQKNLHEYIETEVKKGKLKIKTKEGYNIRTSEKIKITVAFDQLNSVSLAGSGDINTTKTLENSSLKISLAGSGDIELKVENSDLDISLAGSGDIKLNGNTNTISCSVAGSGDIDAKNLKAKIAKANIAGSGNIELNVSEEIHANNVGSGDIYYHGNPTIEKSKSIGSGSVKSKN